MKRSLLVFIALSIGSVLCGYASTIAYTDPGGQGSQAFAGNVALNFDVLSPITVSALGVFNASGSGTITGTIQVAIFDTSTSTAVTPIVTFHGNYTPAGLGFDVFQPVTPWF
jgi:hypothetical protein